MEREVSRENFADALKVLVANGIDIDSFTDEVMKAVTSNVKAAINSALETVEPVPDGGKSKAQNNGNFKFTKKEINQMPLKYRKVFAVKDKVVTYRLKPNGVYEARYHRTDVITVNGKEIPQRIDIEVSSKDLTELKKKFINKLCEIENGNKTAYNVFFNDYAAEWLDIKQRNNLIKESTLKEYKRQLERNVYPFFEGKTIADLNRELIQAFIDTFISRGKIGSAKKHLILLTAILKVAVDDYDIKLPTTNVTVPYYEVDGGKQLDINDEHGLIEYCINNPNVATSSAILVLDCFGLRLSELASIEIIDNKWLQCETSKERSGRNVVLRKIPITPRAKALMPYINIEKAKNTNPSSVESTFHRRFKGKYSPHDLRHTFTSRCNACYVKEELISIWLGHSLTGNTTTKVYTHFTDEFQLKEAEKVVPEWDDLVPNQSLMVQNDQQINTVNVSDLQ